MIEIFNTKQEYNSTAKSEKESTVSLIEEGNLVMVDGVNVVSLEPKVGDAVYKDADGAVVIIAAETLNKSLLPDSWTYVGPVLERVANDSIVAMYGNVSSLPTKKYADVVQFSISTISATTIKFYLHMAGDYAAWVAVEVELTSTEINATSAAEIAAAIELAGNTGNVGYDKHKYWAYLADAQGNKVDSDGTQIIVQCDTWADYRQYQCADSTHALVGCTMTHVTWGDMPESNKYFKVNAGVTNYRGLMNIEGGAAYWSTNGRTLSTNVVPGGEGGNTDPMKLSEYQSSQYAAAIRAAYPTYLDYLQGEFGIDAKQAMGVFALPDEFEMTRKYGPMMAPTKAGEPKAKFPALNWAYTLEGDWSLWGVRRGTILMKDENLNAINATQTKEGKVTISAAANRWWAQRCYATYAWFFYGTRRNLDGSSVYYAIQVGAVTLLKFK